MVERVHMDQEAYGAGRLDSAGHNPGEDTLVAHVDNAAIHAVVGRKDIAAVVDAVDRSGLKPQC